VGAVRWTSFVVTGEGNMNREEFFALISDRPHAEMERIRWAYWLAKNAHRPFYRDGGGRFFEHPRTVAVSLMEHGYFGTDAIIKGLTHDVIEDTNTPHGVIVALFGPEMLRSLKVLSRYKSTFDAAGQLIRPQHKKSADKYFSDLLAASDEDKIVKCADRLHNLQTCGCWEKPRRVRYVGETDQYVIPIAETVTGNPYAAEIKAIALELFLHSDSSWSPG
jgi:GTP diphosphokinase / guanosine-3',5'-bis(diphosphate) 3'-diphosphatase